MEYFENLVYFRIPTKQNSFVCNFIENTCYRPYINSWVVDLGAKQNLRSPIPKGNDLMSVLFDGIIESPCQSKVSKFDIKFFPIDEYVLWL